MGIFFGWIIFSFIIGAIGTNRKIGFWGAFLLSIFLSPLIGLIVTLFSKDKQAEQYEAKILEVQQQQTELLRSMQQSATPPIRNNQQTTPLTIGNIVLPKDPDVRAARLKDLRDRGVITQQEFMEQISRL